MRIAVCDDNKNDRIELCELLKIVWPGTEFFLFDDGQDLLAQIDVGETYDLVFLDIFMQKIGGIEERKYGSSTRRWRLYLSVSAESLGRKHSS